MATSNAPTFVRIDRKALRAVLEPEFRKHLGAHPLEEEVEMWAAQMESEISQSLSTSINRARILRTHREFLKTLADDAPTKRAARPTVAAG